MSHEGLDGVSVFKQKGVLIGRIDLRERCSLLCFGGPHRNRLFMCDGESLYSLYFNTRAVATGSTSR